MDENFSVWLHGWKETLGALGLNQLELSARLGIHEVTLSRMVRGRLPRSKQLPIMLRVCREVLMPRAVELGYPDEVVLKYSEHAIFGMDEPDPAVVIPQVRELAAQRAAEKKEKVVA